MEGVEIPSEETVPTLPHHYDFDEVVSKSKTGMYSYKSVSLFSKYNDTPHKSAHSESMQNVWSNCLIHPQCIDDISIYEETVNLSQILSEAKVSNGIEQKMKALDPELITQFQFLKGHLKDIKVSDSSIKSDLLSTSSEPKILALDLDETLIYSLKGKSEIHAKYDSKLLRKVIINDMTYTFMERPYLHEFLATVSKQFTLVVILCSGLYSIVRRLCQDDSEHDRPASLH